MFLSCSWSGMGPVTDKQYKILYVRKEISVLGGSRSGSTVVVFMVLRLSMLVEVEEEEEFPPFHSQGSVGGLHILDGIFQKSIKRKECSLHPLAKMGSIAYCCCCSAVLCCRRESGSVVMQRNSNWERLFLPTFLAEEWPL